MRFIIIFLIAVVHIQADFLTESIKSSYSVRSMGRGGAMVANPSGGEALHANPAGLAQFGTSYEFSNLDSSKADYQQNESYFIHRSPVGVGFWAQKEDGDLIEMSSVGFAKRNRNGIDWGVAYRSIYSNIDSESSRYWSSDLGLIFHMNEYLDIGLSGKDILSDSNLSVDPTLTSGVLLKNKEESVQLYSDIVSGVDIDDYGNQYVRMGMDIKLTPDLMVRFGGDQQYYSAGASLSFSLLSLDYALQLPKDDESNDKRYALGLRLQTDKGPNQFRNKYALFKPNALAYVEIDGSLTSGLSSMSLLGGRKIGSNDLIQLIRMANKDSDCKGFLIRIKSINSDLGNVALIKELRMELMKSRELGKHIVVYLDGWATMPSYYLATAADKIVMPPMGSIYQLGIQYEVVKFNRLLDRFGVSFNSINSGKHKVASSPFNESLTKSQQETIKASVNNVFLSLQNDIKVARSDDWLTIQPFFDGRMVTAEDAKDVGLIDHVGFWSDIPDYIRDHLNVERDIVLTSIGSFYKATPYDYIWSPFNKIAVVEINGAIMQGKNSHDMLFGGVQSGSDEISAIFHQLSKDPFLKGVILRVNSPGGSMVASDQIYHSIETFKRKTKKPVFTSMGTYAASGGYYIALASDQIFATPVTITASIGVFSGFLNYSELQKEWDVDSYSFSTGKYMDSFSPNQSFSDDDHEMVSSHQHAVYSHFRDRVQQSRDLTDDEVSAVSQGQFMSGEQAKEFGLVDSVGNYSDVIEAMEDEVGIDSSRLVVYGRPQPTSSFSLFKFLFNLF